MQSKRKFNIKIIKMRKKIVAGNWKMNTTVPQGVELAKEVVALSKDVKDCLLVVAPPFTHLAPVAEVLKGSKVALAAQNCADHTSGAYTGEVAVDMIDSIGCTYCILGHSERRQYYGETDEKLVVKVKLALEKNIKPVCSFFHHFLVFFCWKKTKLIEN